MISYDNFFPPSQNPTHEFYFIKKNKVRTAKNICNTIENIGKILLL